MLVEVYRKLHQKFLQKSLNSEGALGDLEHSLPHTVPVKHSSKRHEDLWMSLDHPTPIQTICPAHPVLKFKADTSSTQSDNVIPFLAVR